MSANAKISQRRRRTTAANNIVAALVTGMLDSMNAASA